MKLSVSIVFLALVLGGEAAVALPLGSTESSEAQSDNHNQTDNSQQAQGRIYEDRTAGGALVSRGSSGRSFVLGRNAGGQITFDAALESREVRKAFDCQQLGRQSTQILTFLSYHISYSASSDASRSFQHA